MGTNIFVRLAWSIDSIMCALRLVADKTAGPNAIGILVPPARRTFLIVRPRCLTFDLLLLDEARGTTFRDFDREQAGRAAEALYDALGDWSRGRPVKIEITDGCSADDAASGFQLRVHVGPFHLLACDRQPGVPYAPLLFPDATSARSAADQMSLLLCPPAGVEQECYLNSRHFER